MSGEITTDPQVREARLRIEKMEIEIQQLRQKATWERTAGRVERPECPPQELNDLSLALSSTLEKDLFASWKLTPDQYAQRSIDYAAARSAR